MRCRIQQPLHSQTPGIRGGRGHQGHSQTQGYHPWPHLAGLPTKASPKGMVILLISQLPDSPCHKAGFHVAPRWGRRGKTRWALPGAKEMPPPSTWPWLLPHLLTLWLSKSRFCTGCPGRKTCSSSMMCIPWPTPTALCSRPSPGVRMHLSPFTMPHSPLPTSHIPALISQVTSTHQCPGRGHHRCGPGRRGGARPLAGIGRVAAAAASGCAPVHPSGNGP